jgi:ABC-type Fe3+ transport system substrate-binding protein
VAPSPSTAPSAPASPSAAPSSARWDKILAAAQQERVLSISYNTSEGFDRILAEFHAAYPWVEVQSTVLAPAAFAPRALTEQANGLYAWDLYAMSGFNTVERVLVPADAVGDIRPYLQDLPADVRDDSKWAGGFEVFRNGTSPDSIVTEMSMFHGVWVNRDNIPASQLAHIDQLADPAFKGKITIYRPTASGAGALALATMLYYKGDDFVRTILHDQEPVANDSQRRATELTAQGQVPIGIGIVAEGLTELQDQGVGTHVEPLDDPANTGLRSSGVTVLKNAPHPNVIRVFLAWFLSAQGQESWNREGGPTAVSRRLDVRVYNPAATPDFAHLDQYPVVFNTTAGDALIDRVLAIANEEP